MPASDKNNNLQELMNQAKEKLQKNTQSAESSQEDIYANLLNEDTSRHHEDTPLSSDYDLSGEEYDPEAETKYNLDDAGDVIYEGGPTVAQVAIWKKEYGQNSVAHVRVLERDFVVRTITRMEYKKLISYPNVDAIIREEIICTQCTLYPTGYNFKQMSSDDAGYPGSLSQIIMEISGFTNNYQIEIL